MSRDPRVDDYIARATPAVQPILAHLRAAIHAAVPGLVETIKWGVPHFTLDGRNVVGIAGFKAHAALGLHGNGVSAGKGTYTKIASLADAPSHADLAKTLQGIVGRGGPC